MKKKRIRASRIVLQIVSISFSILLVLLAAVGIERIGKDAYRFGYRIFTEEAVEDAPGTDVLLRVTDQMSAYDLAQKMKQKNLVKDANLFFVQLELSAHAKEIKPGTYTLNTSMKAEELLDVLAQEDEKKKKEKAEQ